MSRTGHLHCRQRRSEPDGLCDKPFLLTPRGRHLTISIFTHQNPVKGRRSPTSLHVSKDGHPRVVSQLLDHELQETQHVMQGVTSCRVLAPQRSLYSSLHTDVGKNSSF